MSNSNMLNFDRFVGIDWTGAKAPVISRAIAVAMCDRGTATPKLIQTHWSRTAVADWVESCVSGPGRTLIGIDCNFGYSFAIGAAQFGKSYDYRDLWQAVEDASAADGNYFAGGYWTHPAHTKYFWQAGKMPKGFAMPRRVTETVCGEAGYGWPESPFKLIGAKQVGKGGLAGMRMALDLKQRCGDHLAVWPFESELAQARARVVITEIYPRQFLRRTGHGSRKLRSAAELDTALAARGSAPSGMTALSDHEGDALISAAGLRHLCGPGDTVPANVARPPMMNARAALCEGWIFGAGDNTGDKPCT